MSIGYIRILGIGLELACCEASFQIQMELISNTENKNLANYLVQVHMLKCVLRNSVPLASKYII